MEPNLTKKEMQETLSTLCKSLKLSQGLADRAMTYANADCQKFLCDLLSQEVLNRKEKRILKKLNSAGFPKRYSKEDFDASEVEFPSGLTYELLLSLGFFKNKKNIVMQGASGTGKSMLSTIIGQEFAYNDVMIYYSRTSALIKALATSSFRGESESILTKLREAQVIILDEFGYVSYDLKGVQILFDFVSEVNEKKSFIVNTNSKFSQWGDYISDNKLTQALLGRFVDNSYILRFNGRDRRLDSHIPSKNNA